MNKIYKYGFLVAIVVLILMWVFRGRDKDYINSLEQDIAAKQAHIDSLVFTNKHQAKLVFKLQERMLIREDSITLLEQNNERLKTSYEKKVAANRYRTVAEFEGYLANRYPQRQRSDSSQMADGADR